MEPDEFNYDGNPITRAGDLLAANAVLDSFVVNVNNNEFPASLNAVIDAVLLLAYVGGLNGKSPKVIKMLSSKRGVEYRKLANQLPSYQRQINARIAELRAEIEGEASRQAYRDKLALEGDNDVPF